MKAIFISDTHLKKRSDRGYRDLLKFLDSLAGREKGNAKRSREEGEIKEGTIAGVDELYILGDFFDFWFSEDFVIYPDFSEIVEMLSNLKDRGIRIQMCEGNHDFFLADYFTAQLGLTVIKDWAAIDLDGRRVLISHGDTVDEKNRRYLLLRQFLRSRFFYKLHRLLPVSFRWKAAQMSSRMSKGLSTERVNALAETMQKFSVRKFRDGFDAVILGHCHKDLLEASIINGGQKTFAILGDWDGHCSYLCYEDGDFALLRFHPPKGRL